MRSMEALLDVPLREALREIYSHTQRSTWMGVEALRNPWDSWAYQEIIWRTRPDLIVEVGVWAGAHALAMANVLNALGHGAVLAIDIDLHRVPELVHQHPRIILRQDEGQSDASVAAAESYLSETGGRRVMVIEDSAHTYDNTLAVLRAWQHLVHGDMYLICEDTVCWNGLDVGPVPGEGPMEALDTFLRESPQFQSDREVEPTITWNPRGYLRRRA